VVQSQSSLDKLKSRPFYSYIISHYIKMDGFYIGLLLGIGVLGYREHKQLCRLETEYQDLRVLLNQQKEKQEKIKISLKDLFE
jgi:hypothetical protein